MKNVVEAANVRTAKYLLKAGWHSCSVAGCRLLWRRGGVLSPEARCPKHYHRERRGSPTADTSADPPKRVRLTIRCTPEVIEVVDEKRRELRRMRRPASISDAVIALIQRTKEGTP